MNQKLLFVYNAKSGKWNRLKSFVHKIFRPATYNCNLCLLTHDNFGEKTLWKHFIKTSEYRMVFLYKDQFLKLHGVYENRYEYPVVFQLNNGKIETIISTQEIRKMSSAMELIKLLKKRLHETAAIRAAS